jgi:PAS domain S-box-containing protein
MLVVWQGGNIGLANDRAAKTFGYTREELVGQPIDMLIPERIRGRHKDHLAGYFRSPTARMMGGNLALSGRRKDGSEFPVEVSISPFGFDGEQGVITAVRDVTERKQLEASLEASRQQITNSARLSALGTMAGGIAHEINNPLAVISALADDLKDLAEANAASRDNVLRAANRMLHCTDRIGKIVRSLRYVARDGTRDHFAKASVEDVVFRTLDLTFERFRQNSVELQAPRIDPGLWLECREVNVSQILLNLLQNAFDAAMEAADPRWVRLEVTTQDDQLIFSVIDSGNGVPADVRARIMEPFFTTKPAGKGTGLGLSLSKQMALEHGGKLDLGESGGHTCFSLRLPRTQESPVPCT